MANSTQAVGGKAETFNDLDLMALVCLLDTEAASRPDRYRELRPVMDRWKRGLVSYGPGTIELALDDLASSDGQRSELMLLLAATDDRVDKFGETVPASLLNQRRIAPGVTFSDYPTSLLKATIKKINALLLECGPTPDSVE